MIAMAAEWDKINAESAAAPALPCGPCGPGIATLTTAGPLGTVTFTTAGQVMG
jgi:hypothetical protein